MKRITQTAAVLLMAGGLAGQASAKDLYVSATGNDSNNGLTEATPKKTLSALDKIIEIGDCVNVSGILNMADEVPSNFNKNVSYAGTDLELHAGQYVSHDEGKKLGFNLTARGDKKWQGITFVGKNPETDGFTGDGKWAHFIIRGNNEGGYNFVNLCFVDGISNIDGGTIFIKDGAEASFTNCVFKNNHPDWSTYTLEDKALKGDAGTSERGGCIRVETNSVVNFRDCWFEGNMNRHGGAILITGTSAGLVNYGGVTVTNCTFFENTAYCFEDPEQYVDNSQGGAIEVWPLTGDCYLTVDHCVFDSNKTFNNGGAIYIYDNVLYGHYADITIKNSAFFNNESERGAAIQIANFANGPMESKEYLTKTKNINILNSVFSNNHAITDGGAILYWGASTDGTRPDHPKDELRVVNCSFIGNSTDGNAGHGAGYKEMDRANDGAAFGKIGNANRYFYNCLFENNYANQSSELADFCTYELYGHYFDNNCVGRIVITGNGAAAASVEDFLTLINDEKGAENIIQGYCGEQLGDNEFKVAGDAMAPALYDMSDGFVPGIALPDGSELKTAGDVKWLKLDQRELSVPNTDDGVVYRSGYDISAKDGLGFERPEGTCAIGAAEYDVAAITPYLDGSIDLPYLKDLPDPNSSVSVVENELGAYYDGNTVYCQNAIIMVYSLNGTCVLHGHDAVNVSGLESGVYVVKMRSAKGADMFKFAK